MGNWIKNKYGARFFRDVVSVKKETFKTSWDVYSKKQQKKVRRSDWVGKLAKEVLDVKKNLFRMRYPERIAALRDLAKEKTPFSTPYIERRKQRFRPQGECAVCIMNPATCQHHIVMLKNGGSNRAWNRIQICDDCHSRIHDWLIPKRVQAQEEEMRKAFVVTANV